MSSARAPLPSPSASDSDEERDLQVGTLDLSHLHVQVQEGLQYERKLGDSELSYYLPGRASGVNDMYVCPCLEAYTMALKALQVSSPGHKSA
jgi:hypothetical protein